MIRCHQCGTDNLDGSEYCDECGSKLQAATSRRSGGPLKSPQASTGGAPPPPPSFNNDQVQPKPATPYGQPQGYPSMAQPPAPQSVPFDRRSKPQQSQPIGTRSGSHNNLGDGRPGSSHGSGHGSSHGSDSGRMRTLSGERRSSGRVDLTRGKLIIQRGGNVGREFPLFDGESLIGRWDADGGIFPEVDLDQDDPEAKISRRHARLTFINNQFLIEDLGSVNGTFINRGPRLSPGSKQPLNHGDEIIVGKTFLKFFLV